MATFTILVAMAWLGASALTSMDTRGAHELRAQLGIESYVGECGGSGPMCTYDDAEQRTHDQVAAQELRVRTAILFELERRIDSQIVALTDLRARVEASVQADALDVDWSRDEQASAAVYPASDLRPLATQERESIALAELRTARRSGSPEFLRAIDWRLTQLHGDLARLHAAMARPGAIDSRAGDASTATPTALMAALETESIARHEALTDWLNRTGPDSELNLLALSAVRRDAAALEEGLRPGAALWQSTWANIEVPLAAYEPAALRYRSTVPAETTWRLFGTLLIALAGFFALVVSPTVTATATAKEREAGTLPVLRMTGMSADDLVGAMVIGPNVFALTCAFALGTLGALATAFTAGPSATLLPLGLMLVLAPAIHLMAVGLGDALGHRVNGVVVGALVAIGVLAPGIIGAALCSLQVVHAGLLLGPLPAFAAATSELTGFTGVGLDLGDGWLGQGTLAFAVLGQLLLGYMCLRSWRRRVEQPWAPLFVPAEGLLLAAGSIAASALCLLDLSNRTHAQSFDALNLLTFLSCSFLVPVLGWLLVTSLRRPARARAAADTTETRRAFLRFQGILIGGTMLVGLAYHFVLSGSLMATTASELMWATLAQVLLVVETAVASFLWVSRRSEGKLRASFACGSILLLQVVGIAAAYGLEVEHVARTNSAAMPLLLNVDASVHWVGFVVLLWAAGLAIIFTALRRDRERAPQAPHSPDLHMPEDDEEEDGMPGRRLIH